MQMQAIMDLTQIMETIRTVTSSSYLHSSEGTIVESASSENLFLQIFLDLLKCLRKLEGPMFWVQKNSNPSK